MLHISPLLNTFALKSKGDHAVQETIHNRQSPLPDKRKIQNKVPYQLAKSVHR